MISSRLRRFILEVDRALVATVDATGKPHLAAVEGLEVPDSRHLVLTSWFCFRTLENLRDNPALALVVIDRRSGLGYQFTGGVARLEEAGLRDGSSGIAEEPGLPQVAWRLVVAVREILEFSAGPHTDHPLCPET